MTTSANPRLQRRLGSPGQIGRFGPMPRPAGHISKTYTSPIGPMPFQGYDSPIGPMPRPRGYVSRSRMPTPGARRKKPCPKGYYFFHETGGCRKLPGTPKRRRRSKSRKSRRRKSKSAVRKSRRSTRRKSRKSRRKSRRSTRRKSRKSRRSTRRKSRKSRRV